MKLRLADYVTCFVCAVCLATCDGGSDDASCCSCEGNRDLTGYEDDARAIVEHTFSGMIEDGDASIPCRFAGQPFVLDVQVASPMTCDDTEWNPADCAHACYAHLELEGELDVDDTYHVTGSADMFNLSVLSVILTTDLPCYVDGIGDGLLDDLSFGDEISRFNWVIDHEAPDEADGPNCEICMLNVESVE